MNFEVFNLPHFSPLFPIFPHPQMANSSMFGVGPPRVGLEGERRRGVEEEGRLGGDERRGGPRGGGEKRRRGGKEERKREGEQRRAEE